MSGCCNEIDNVILLAKLIQFRNCKACICRQFNRNVPECKPKFCNNSLQVSDTSLGWTGVPWSQLCSQRKSIFGKYQKRRITSRFIESVVERQLLVSMSRIACGIHSEPNSLRSFPFLFPPSDPNVYEKTVESTYCSVVDGILKTA